MDDSCSCNCGILSFLVCLSNCRFEFERYVSGKMMKIDSICFPNPALSYNKENQYYGQYTESSSSSSSSSKGAKQQQLLNISFKFKTTIT
jgi:hypothetical protein